METLDLNFYKNFYKQYFSDYSDSELRNHWITFGMDNGCIPNRDYLVKISKFDWKFYHQNNLDLENLSDKEDYLNHWIEKGIFENRIYTFDSQLYKEFYPDINSEELTDEFLLAHWYLIGKNEGRICCDYNLSKITALENEIIDNNLKEMNMKKDNLDTLEIENDISKNKLEVEFSDLVCSFLDNEKNKLTLKKELLNAHFENNLLSLQNKNLDVKKSIEEKHKLTNDLANENIKKHNANLQCQMEKNNLQLMIKKKNVAESNLKSLEASILKNKKKTEIEIFNFEENIIRQKTLIRDSQIEEKKNILVNLELKKRILYIEHEIIHLNTTNSSKLNDKFFNGDELEDIKNQIRIKLDSNLDTDLFGSNQNISDKNIDKRIKDKIKETNNLKITNKKRIFQENILDSGIKLVQENKIQLVKSINKLKLESQEEIYKINHTQLKNKETFSKQFNDFKLHHSKMIENSQSYYDEIKNQKKIIFEKYEKQVIENDKLILEVDLLENRKRINDYKDLENKISKKELENKKIKLELEEVLLKEQENRNKTLEGEIKELKMNIEKNELLITEQESDLEAKINLIDIEKRNFELKSEKMKSDLVLEKNRKISEYLNKTMDYRLEINKKRSNLKDVIINEMNKENEMEVRNLTLISSKRKKTEESLENDIVQLEKTRIQHEIQKRKKKELFEKELDHKMMFELDTLKEKKKIEKISLDIIEKMERFQQSKMGEFDNIYQQKLKEFDQVWKNFCILFKKNSDSHLEKIFINEEDYTEQFRLYLKFYSKEVEKDIMDIDTDINKRKLLLNEKNNELLIQKNKECELEKENLESEKRNFLTKIENLENESKIVSQEQVNTERKKYIIDKKNEIKKLEKRNCEKEKDITLFIENIQNSFNEVLMMIENESEKRLDSKNLYLTLEEFYKKYLLSKKSFMDIIKKNNYIKFQIEDLKKIKNSKDDNKEIRKYEEQNRLLNEFNQLFKAKKGNIENKIKMLLNNNSLPDNLSTNTIIDTGKFNKLNMIKLSLEKMYNQYPNLFHKHILGISSSKISYEVIKYSKNRKKYIAHLHCFNIDNFDLIYGPYINLIKKYFYIIITFSFGKSDKMNNQDVSILKIKNKGMDIGGKIACLHFLELNELKYDIIFFLHSKSNNKKRNEYFAPFLSNEASLSNIISTLKNNRGTGAIFPNCVHSYSKNTNEYRILQKNNITYLNELSRLLGIQKENPIIFEGNVFMIKKEVLGPVIKNLELLYSLLNDESSFDFNWFKIYNNLGDNITPRDAYNHLMSAKKKIKIGNNIPLMLQTHPSSLPDGMIEHAIERIWDGLLIKFNKRYIVV